MTTAMFLQFCVPQLETKSAPGQCNRPAAHRSIAKVVVSQICKASVADSRLEIRRAFLTKIVFTRSHVLQTCSCLRSMDSTFLMQSGGVLEKTRSIVLFPEIAEMTSVDPVLSRVLRFPREGWPEEQNEEEMKPLFRRRCEISIQDGVLFSASPSLKSSYFDPAGNDDIRLQIISGRRSLLRKKRNSKLADSNSVNGPHGQGGCDRVKRHPQNLSVPSLGHSSFVRRGSPWDEALRSRQMRAYGITGAHGGKQRPLLPTTPFLQQSSVPSPDVTPPSVEYYSIPSAILPSFTTRAFLEHSSFRPVLLHSFSNPPFLHQTCLPRTLLLSSSTTPFLQQSSVPSPDVPSSNTPPFFQYYSIPSAILRSFTKRAFLEDSSVPPTFILSSKSSVPPTLLPSSSTTPFLHESCDPAFLKYYTFILPVLRSWSTSPLLNRCYLSA
ncbi:unnamed protein product [Cyprideis torosa]|uniref:Uncharacterized protein n=1 Tax=Cyprideis torosa TaxID=163714 RepID=A0A7R8WB02_9CRUS|nr:unnamed protein product [Cyprideis torosa]CAG0891640.1 unnamed protein product [Cyprideis torosa]